MAISFFNEEVNKPKIEYRKIKTWIKAIIESSGKSIGDINYIFCSDEYILKINLEYLNHDYFTDIITFNYCNENIISGDIFISIDTVNNNANEFGTKDTEIFRVMIHGILHLIGFDDNIEIDKKIMREEEDKALCLLKSI